jgi:hypothetical protein
MSSSSLLRFISSILCYRMASYLLVAMIALFTLACFVDIVSLVSSVMWL